MESHQIHKGDFPALRHRFTSVGFVMERKTFAGFPPTLVLGGTSRVTTLPAPTIAFPPITMFERIVDPEPIEAPRFTTAVSPRQSSSVCSPPSGGVARG